jgi:hypothetical protein
VRRLAEGTAELAAEVRGREMRRAGERVDVEGLAVAGVDEVFRAQEVPRRMNGPHDFQSRKATSRRSSSSGGTSSGSRRPVSEIVSRICSR